MPNPGRPPLSERHFPDTVREALHRAGWHPGRRDIRQAEIWADTLHGYVSPAGHRHTILPAAVEAWAAFGGLRVAAPGPGREIAPTELLIDPLCGLHLARTFADLGRALGTDICPLGEEAPGPDGPGGGRAALAMDSDGRVYSLDHTGDWYLGRDVEEALTRLLTGCCPVRLSPVGG
ncbi:SUKH-3 domain-containing protein [Streptomyces sp. TP-A0874]|uniref:SUKH-3 domain-containing protein n=1 Tax=Streptomyces sp. TP-A0874 TaxID=549819 RepID=UPI000852EFE9|nr:SUKH-3 domain-containing protein [Streptomyces sp. TP-A0874]